MKAAKVLVDCLINEGCKYVFGIPGTHNLAIYDELYKSKEIKSILVTHEQCAGFMADIYGRVSHSPGVAIVTTGPGALNSVNSLAQAFVESSPVILLATQCNSRLQGKGCYHELSHSNAQLNIFKEVTKWASRIDSVETLPDVISEAFFKCKSDRPRPVYLEIPENLLAEEISEKPLSPIKEPLKPKASEKELLTFIKLVKEASFPVILAGGGILCADAKKELVEFSEAFNIPIMTTAMGKSSCPSNFKLNLGLGCGLFSTPAAQEYIKKSDLIIAIGTRFNEFGTGFFTLKFSGKLIHIDVDKKEINKNYPAFFYIVADAKIFLKQIISFVNKAALKINRDLYIDKITSKSSSFPSNLIKQENIGFVDVGLLLSKIIESVYDEPAIFIGDAGNSSPWLLGSTMGSDHLVITPSGYNSMGVSVPGGIAAKLASPKSHVFSISGDGSFLMTGLETLTAVRNKIKFTIIVLHDERYNTLAFFQKLKYDGRYADTKLQTFGFADFMNRIGGRGIKLSSNETIKTSIKDALSFNGPSLIEAKVHPDSLPYLFEPLKLLYK